MNQTLVSCILPVADNIKQLGFILDCFLNQDYPQAELVIIDDGNIPVKRVLPNNPQIRYFYSAAYIGRVGVKRNYGCFNAHGEIIMHWDDGQWYAPDWISQQVDFLANSGADITGLAFPHHFSAVTDTFWKGSIQNRNNPANRRQGLDASTLAYWKVFQEQHPFKDLEQGGEDQDFVQNSGAKVFAHDYIDGFVSCLSPGNTIEDVLLKNFKG